MGAVGNSGGDIGEDDAVRGADVLVGDAIESRSDLPSGERIADIEIDMRGRWVNESEGCCGCELWWLFDDIDIVGTDPFKPVTRGAS